MMKIFIDSADLNEIKQGYMWSVTDGVTTNASLLKIYGRYCTGICRPHITIDGERVYM